MNNSFTNPRTVEGEAYNLMQMLKIKDLQEIIKGWAIFSGKLIKRYNIAECEEERETLEELFQISSDMIETNINHFINIYRVREPLYKKYTMSPEEFRKKIKEIFDEKIAEITRETIEKSSEEKLDFKRTIEDFERNMEKVAVYAGHCYGEDLYPTETKEVQEAQRKAFEMTKSLIEENIEATIEVYKLVYKLAPEKYKKEPKEFEVEVKDYFKIGISIKFEEGTMDINKKFQMFQRFKRLKG